MLEHQLMVGLDRLVADVVESAVVEDVAVLQNLDERGAAMRMRPLERFAEMLLLDVDRARDERRVAPRATVIGLNGKSTEPIGVDLVTLPTSEVGEYCPLVKP